MEPSPWAWSPGWPEVGTIVVLSVAYVALARRYPPSRPRQLAFAVAMLLLLGLFVSPVETLATNYLLSAHFLQNVALAEWAPALIVVGLAPAAASALGEAAPLRQLGRPFVALPLWLVTYAVWHVPALYDAALRRQAWLLPIEHLCYLLAGIALWWPVFTDAPSRLRSGGKAAYLFAAFLLASPIGLLLALLPRTVYSFYEEAPRIWELSAIRDQQLAGMFMSVAEAIVFFAVFCVYFVRFLAEEDRDEAHAPVRSP